jgi:hypothetical protein
MEKQNKKGIKSKMILERANTKPNVEFHYTPEELVKYCIKKRKNYKDTIKELPCGREYYWNFIKKR